MVNYNTFWVSLSKYNVVAVVASAIDFSIFFLLSKGFGLWYIVATITGAILGGISAFLLSRRWVFNSTAELATSQFAKYSLVWLTSAFLNTAGLYLMVENTKLDEVIAKIIISILVGIGFNFFAAKNFVFKKKSNEK